jgi:hypothetical protein
MVVKLRTDVGGGEVGLGVLPTDDGDLAESIALSIAIMNASGLSKSCC